MTDHQRQDMGIGDNRPPRWILAMWAVFGLWAVIYLSLYWLPDLMTWAATEDPDAAQWHYYNK